MTRARTDLRFSDMSCLSWRQRCYVDLMLRGSCQCEAVEIVAVVVRANGMNCSCTICRKISGAPFASVVIVDKGAFHIERGGDLLSHYNATPECDRLHCRRCHAPIYTEARNRPDLPLFVAATLFDGREVAHVTFDHIFVDSLVPWHRLGPGGRRFGGYPE